MRRYRGDTTPSGIKPFKVALKFCPEEMAFVDRHHRPMLCESVLRGYFDIPARIKNIRLIVTDVRPPRNEADKYVRLSAYRSGSKGGGSLFLRVVSMDHHKAPALYYPLRRDVAWHFYDGMGRGNKIFWACIEYGGVKV